MPAKREPPIVSAAWLLEHLDDPGVRILQVDDDELAYEMGHIPGARYLCWHVDLAAGDSRDVLPAAAFAALMDALGIGLATTVVLYGDQMNLWAAYAWWVLRLWRHPDVRLLDGGYATWARSGWPMEARTRARTGAEGCVPAAYPVPRTQCGPLRASRADVEGALVDGRAAIVDVRSPAGYGGEVALGGLAAPVTGALRGGHIPGALSLPWASLLDGDSGLLLPGDQLGAVAAAAGVPFDQQVIVYCELGASSALVCLVLGEILGHPAVANYDGSWLEWAATIGLAVARPRADSWR